MGIKERILGILENMNTMDNVKEYYKDHDDLTELKFDSLTFIGFVVKLEEEFDIEFDDESLDYSKFVSLFVLCKYVESLMDDGNGELEPASLVESEEEGSEADDEKTEQVRAEVLKILGHYCDVEQLGSDVWESQLSDLGFSMEQGQKILQEIQSMFHVELDQKIILAYNLFTLKKICSYLGSQI